MPAAPRRIRPAPPVPRGLGAPAGPDGPPDWELSIHGELTDKQADLLSKLLEVPARSRGLIYFDSCGGSAYVGLGLASLIRFRGLEATAVVGSECSSAAILPFAACRERYVTAHSTLLFHPIRWSSEEDIRMEDAVEWARHFQKLETDLDRLLCRMLPMSEELLAKWTRPGRFVTGREVVEAGLAREIDLFGDDVWRQIARHRETAAKDAPAGRSS
jgi:ATP-dependent protease ClpP protease subunit